jgi:hypothetical protein
MNAFFTSWACTELLAPWYLNEIYLKKGHRAEK